MPFFALVDETTGDVVDVVMSLDHPAPPGTIVVELPGPGDDVRAWLSKRERGGGGVDEAFAEREAHEDKKDAGKRGELSDGELFFARLDHAVLRAEIEGRHLAVLLFMVAPADRQRADAYTLDVLGGAGQELLPCDVMASLRPHLVGVLLPDVDARELVLSPGRGEVRQLTYPDHRAEIDALRRRRHPWLRNTPHAAAS